MQERAPKRQYAKKVLIGDVLSADFVEQEGTPAYLSIGEEKVTRVNVMGVVVAIVEGALRSIIIDDGSGRLTLRSFDRQVEGVDVGDPIMAIGKIREYGSERYLTPDIFKKIDIVWLELRKKECHSHTPVAKQAQPVPAGDSQSAVEHIISYIREKDEGDGVDVEVLVNQVSVADAERLIDHLIKQGDIFELKPGVVKLLE